ncbi:MAG: hypothetical protein LUF26_00360 [Firmicutes bacterium]|nr:hypothetical protein [Bacillota bacterium]
MNEQETKKCKYCQCEIDAKAKICPNCKKKQGKNGCLIAIITVVVLIILICIIATCANSGSNSDSSGSGTSSVTETDAETNETTSTAEKTSYAIGETWTVDGQWSLTITGVTATDYRNQFYDTHTPSAVYIIDYTYTNIGYEDDSGLLDGLYFNLDYETIVDSNGTLGYSYPAADVTYPDQTPVGATCNAQAAIGVDNAGSFTLTVNKYDGNGKKQKASFDITAE